MTGSDDHVNVAPIRPDDAADADVLAAARRVLSELVPPAPPSPSDRLAVVLREGTSPARTRSGMPAWFARAAGRVASLGVAAKLMLAAGVAVAGAGGAATAVELGATHSGGHGDRSDRPPHAHPTPTGAASHPATPDADSTDHDGEPEPAQSSGARHDGGDDQTTSGGRDGATSGSDDTGPSSRESATSDSGDDKSGGGATTGSSGSSDGSGSSSGSGSDGGSGSSGGSGSDGGSVSSGSSDGGGEH